ncbi:MAG: hypothetical protein NTY38_13750 [Acidobacteria bacterium]|nr:hypothetical protein [Acidobacteriota bacterium]
MKSRFWTTCVVGVCSLTMGAVLDAAGEFQRLGTYKGLGSMVNTTVGPGPRAGSQRFYASYLYVEHAIDVVAVDPDMFANPAQGESGAWAMTKGPDGNVYLGTLPKAHFLKLDPKAGTLIDLGRPSATEEYIWAVAFGTDKKLYGATYPQSKLVRYDPATGKLEDLGRTAPVEQYARHIAGSDEGFMYVGIGTCYRLEGWTATPIAAAEAEPAEPTNVLADGRTVRLEGRSLHVTNPATRQTVSHAYDYAGNVLNIFRIAFGPDRKLYGSSVLPIHLLRQEADGRIAELGNLGGGEYYSFLSHGRWLLGAAYSALAPLMKFDPSRPFQLEKGDKNPVLVNYKDSDSGWRPEAMVEGPDGKVYVGAVSGYGKLGGALMVWDPRSDTVEQYPHVVPDQSVISVAVWKDLIVGGTTIGGGGGSRPTTKDARIFLWDPKTRKKLFETTPAPGASKITGLITARNGLVYGIGGKTLFVFDPAARQIVDRKELPFSRIIYNATANGEDGKLWGLCAEGIFRIDPETREAAIVARPPHRITAGFAMRGRTIYVVSDAEIWSWTRPESAN